MPVLELDEIPRNAGQYLGTVGVHRHIVFNANPPDTFRVHPRFNRDYVSGLQAPLLASRHPRIFVHFESQPVTRAVHKQLFQPVSC